MPNLLKIGALCLALLQGPEIGAETLSSEVPGLTAIRLLHDGRFDEAEEALARLPDDDLPPRRAFLEAYVAYWRLLFDDENPTLLEELERKLDRVVEMGKSASPSEAKSPHWQIWLGTARLLRAQVYASRKKPIKAAYEAKRGKRLLERVQRGEDLAEAYFGLGTYNYYASQVSILIKGFRFLLALPGGNRKLGLEQLDRASRESRYFSLEAGILLATIYSGKRERRFAEADDHLRSALVRRSDSVALLHAAAILDLSLARPRQASAHLDRALTLAARSSRTDSSVLAALRYRRAETEMELFRPDLALEQLRPLILEETAVPASMADSLVALATTALSWTEAPAWLGSPPLCYSDVQALPEIRTALKRARKALDLERKGDLDGAAAALVEMAGQENPASPAMMLLAGRALLLSGRGRDALAWLARAEGSGSLPPPWLTTGRLMAGRAADLSGNRDRAVAYYRKVLDAGPFHGRDAAYHHLERPFAGDEP